MYTVMVKRPHSGVKVIIIIMTYNYYNQVLFHITLLHTNSVWL